MPREKNQQKKIIEKRQFGEVALFTRSLTLGQLRWHLPIAALSQKPNPMKHLCRLLINTQLKQSSTNL